MHLKHIALATVIALIQLAPQIGFTANAGSGISLTEQAAESFRKGDLEAADNIAKQAVAQEPQDWFGHAELSFYEWHQGNILTAIEEGQRAVDLSPHNYMALINLALIKEGLDDNSGAIPLYGEASKISPDNSVPLLGIVRSKIKAGKVEEAHSLLAQMACRSAMGFDWYYEIADIYLRLDKTELAIQPIETALKLAKTPGQKAASSIDALMVYLRNNQLEKAAQLKEVVFDGYKPKEYQLYIRTAQSMLQPGDCASGKHLLDLAIANLTNNEDAEGFYRLAEVFEAKAAAARKDASASNTDAGAWLDLAASSYRKAGALIPQAKSFLALASVLDELGKPAEMAEALGNSKKLDSSDTLSDYLMQQLKLQGSVGNSNRCPVNLQEVHFKICNLNCACHVSKVGAALLKAPGVAFVFVDTRKKVYNGIMMLDPGKTSPERAFGLAKEDVKVTYAAMKPPMEPEFVLLSQEKVRSAADAIRAVQLAQYGQPDIFFNIFKPVVPMVPVQDLAAATKANL